jgi:alkanesulfonate monooxygenase
MTESRANEPPPVDILSTCPPSSAYTDGYREQVARIARWSEAAGCVGILVYSDNGLLDPWLVSQLIVESTESIAPLVAVQPVYMHPYTVAKMVASLAVLHGRRVHLNMVSGGFRNDLLALNDETPHDRRYDRLVEYTTIVRRLLEGNGPVTFEGSFYRVQSLVLSCAPPQDLLPEIFVAGSSVAGLGAARALDAIAVKYPKPVDQEEGFEEVDVRKGIRVGILTREREREAWEVANARFPGDRRGRLLHELAMKVSDSVWHKELSAMGDSPGDGPYWLHPFENYQTMCPYLVGSYRNVGQELGRYIDLGARTFILDVPANEEDLWHARRAFGSTLPAVS